MFATINHTQIKVGKEQRNESNTDGRARETELDQQKLRQKGEPTRS